jgi:hypothetical protein
VTPLPFSSRGERAGRGAGKRERRVSREPRRGGKMKYKKDRTYLKNALCSEFRTRMNSLREKLPFRIVFTTASESRVRCPSDDHHARQISLLDLSS